jgi:nifR3 family TIM-barrel protein
MLCMSLLPKDPHGCPFLILAPMEGVGDAVFRKAIASIGGFDESVRDFLRVPKNAHVQSISAEYDPHEIAPIPLAAQIMGSDPELMASMAQELVKRGAHRIDVNCGCPSNTVTGRGAGSSLLKEPSFLHTVVKSVVDAVSIPVTVKMRSGFDDTSLFKENLLAAQETGVRYITLHPRTKADGYGPPAQWALIAQAKALLKIPVVGNGDILTVPDALRMLEETGCDALMIGRGCVINPFLFHQIKAHFAGLAFQARWDTVPQYLQLYLQSMHPTSPLRTQVNKLKQLFGFLFKANPHLLSLRQSVLTSSYTDPQSLLSFAVPLLQQGYQFHASF